MRSRYSMLFPGTHSCGLFSKKFIFDLANGKVKVTASEWPSFFYDQALYNPKDEEAGLLKGYLLLQVRAMSFLCFMT